MKDVAVEDAVARRADHRIRSAVVQRDLAVGGDETGAKTDARSMSFADPAKTHHESHRAVGHVGLIGVHDDAGIAHRGGLK